MMDFRHKRPTAALVMTCSTSAPAPKWQTAKMAVCQTVSCGSAHHATALLPLFLETSRASRSSGLAGAPRRDRLALFWPMESSVLQLEERSHVAEQGGLIHVLWTTPLGASLQRPSSMRRTGCMRSLQLCAIALTNQKPARLNRLTNTRATAFMTMRCR
jgi:hypothetical protein